MEMFDPPDALRTLFNGDNALVVCIIDDSLEPINASEINDGDRGDIFDAYVGLDEASPYQTQDAVTRDLVASLLEQAWSEDWATAPPAQVVEVVHSIAGRYRAGWSELRQFKDYLANLNVRVACEYETDTARLIEKIPQDAKVIFLDFMLQRQVERDVATSRAAEVARLVHERTKDKAECPIVVIMSSEPPNDQERQDLIESTGLLGGVVHILHKDVLKDQFQVCGRLAHYMRTSRVARAAQRFVSALQQQVEQRARDFAKRARQLLTDDYLALLRLTIRSDGDPLGDYVSWLFGEAVRADVIERPLASQLSELNLFRESDLGGDFPAPAPTPALRAFLADALLGPARPRLLKHNHASREDQVDVSFGDVFLSVRSERRTVWLVISPECDLARARSSDNRDRAETPVLLLPGRVGQLSVARDFQSNQILRLSDNSLVKIDWKIGRLISIPFGRIGRWARKGSKERVGRMRAAFALELQNETFRTLGRVGVPAAAPWVAQYPVTIVVNIGSPETIEPRFDNGATTYFARDSNDSLKQFVYFSDTVISVARQAILNRIDTVDSQQRSHVRQTVANSNKWWELKDPRAIAGADGQAVQLIKNNLSYVRETGSQKKQSGSAKANSKPALVTIVIHE